MRGAGADPLAGAVLAWAIGATYTCMLADITDRRSQVSASEAGTITRGSLR